LLRLSSVLAIVAAWFLISWYIGQTNERGNILFPSPFQVVFTDLPGLSVFADGDPTPNWSKAVGVIFAQGGLSLGRLLAGTALGVVVGVLLGLALSWSQRLRYLAEPTVLLLRSIPILALIPLFIVWFGGSETGNVAYIAFAIASMVVVATIEAVRNVPLVYLNFAATLGATRFQRYREVVIPAILPEILGGIRVGIGFSWAILLAAEYLVAQAGLGRILIQAERWLYTGRMVAVVALIALLAYLFNYIFLKVEKHILRWMPS
jgi:ABC-type nitrate/sulfonate/bicarbonate transport system permease component